MDIIAFITSFFKTNHISILEAIMLMCWGLSWPVSVIKALRTKLVHGKSPLFMSLIAFGYLCGILNKVLYSRDYLVLLYIFNLSMILTDLYLYTRYNLRLVENDTEIINKKLIPKLELAKNIIVDSMEQKRYTRRTHETSEAFRAYNLPVLHTVRVRDRQEDVSLNGTIIRIRPIRSEDESALRGFFETLSQESVYLRFGQLRINMLHDHFAQLCRVDYNQDFAFVAVVRGDEGGDKIIGEVRLNKLADQKSAELSFIVDDQWQGKGVGHLLMAFCLKVAEEIGLKTLLMFVTKNNIRMKRFGHKYDFQKLPCKKEDDMEEWQLKIDQAGEAFHPTRQYPVAEMLSWQIPSVTCAITELNGTSIETTVLN